MRSFIEWSNAKISGVPAMVVPEIGGTAAFPVTLGRGEAFAPDVFAFAICTKSLIRETEAPNPNKNGLLDFSLTLRRFVPKLDNCVMTRPMSVPSSSVAEW
eukprot:1247249-Amphidinium_carterae.1